MPESKRLYTEPTFAEQQRFGVEGAGAIHEVMAWRGRKKWGAVAQIAVMGTANTVANVYIGSEDTTLKTVAVYFGIPAIVTGLSWVKQRRASLHGEGRIRRLASRNKRRNDQRDAYIDALEQEVVLRGGSLPEMPPIALDPEYD